MRHKLKILLIILLVLLALSFLTRTAADPDQIRCGGGLKTCMSQEDLELNFGSSPILLVYGISNSIFIMSFVLSAVDIVVLIVLKKKFSRRNTYNTYEKKNHQ